MKRIFPVLFALLLALSLFTGCGGTENAPENVASGGASSGASGGKGSTNVNNPATAGGNTWTILVYMCGTDLETLYGCLRKHGGDDSRHPIG